jgi:hypothetical protein
MNHAGCGNNYGCTPADLLAIEAPGLRPSTPYGGRAQAPLTAGYPVLLLTGPRSSVHPE